GLLHSGSEPPTAAGLRIDRRRLSARQHKDRALMPSDGHVLAGPEGSLGTGTRRVLAPDDEIAELGNHDPVLGLVAQVRPLSNPARDREPAAGRVTCRELIGRADPDRLRSDGDRHALPIVWRFPPVRAST